MRIVVRCMNKIFLVLFPLFFFCRWRFVFSEVNLSETLASMRAIFNGTNGRGQTVHREAEVITIAFPHSLFFFTLTFQKSERAIVYWFFCIFQVEVLNLSKTQTSARSLLSLHRMSNLRVLYLDHCPSLKKSGKDVFSLLSRKSQIPNLEVCCAQMFNSTNSTCCIVHFITIFFNKRSWVSLVPVKFWVWIGSLKLNQAAQNLIQVSHLYKLFQSLILFLTLMCSLFHT